MITYAVLEIVRSPMGVPIEHNWQPRVDGHLMTEAEATVLAEALRTNAPAATGTIGKRDYRVCRWEDATELIGAVR